jgi:hypothetical protein
MIRSVSVLLLLTTLSFSVVGQEKTDKTKPKKIARPDIPGSFVFDLGLNRGAHRPANFTQGFWGSRTINLYYQYPLRILKSHISFDPGIGFSFERYKLVNEFTLNPDANSDGSFSLVQANTLYNDPRKSMIVMNYLEVPLALRFDTNPEDRARSFSVSVGARGGILYDGFTKLKYKDTNNEVKEFKDKQNHGLNPYRYGIYGRIGGGAFNLFCYYTLSPLFASNKGPDLTKMNTVTIGISINGF